MNKELKLKLSRHLASFLTENRRHLFEQVIQDRTRHLTVVLENLYQAHNASAVLRTCDCLGIQDVHIIENTNRYEVNPDIALGSSKWLTMHRYRNRENNTLEAFQQLRKSGYQIIATSPHREGYNLEEFIPDEKTALIFGTEMNGLSSLAIDESDAYLKIPLYGFTESYNISVSVGIILYHLIYKLKNSMVDWQLNSDEMLDIQLHWMRNSIKRVDLIERKFLNSY